LVLSGAFIVTITLHVRRAEGLQKKRLVSGSLSPYCRTAFEASNSVDVPHGQQEQMFIDTDDHGDTAKCFVPEMLVEFINKNVSAGREYVEPTSFFLSGVCLLVDISGFTKLSGDFCGMGKSGIDELQLATNGYMGKLVEIIYSFGGEIIKFAGDAIICVFSSHFISTVATKSLGGKKLRRSVCSFNGILTNIDIAAQLSGKLSPSSKDAYFSSVVSPRAAHHQMEPITADVVLRAMHCAHMLRDVQTDRLSVHVAMSCGEMCFGILGGHENRWECLISGPCIHELSDCLDDAPSKHAVISDGCAKILAKAIADSTPAYIVSSFKDNGEVHEIEKTTNSMVTKSGKYEFCLEALPSGNHRIMFVFCDTNLARLSVKYSKMGLVDEPHHSSKATVELIKQFVPAPIADQLEIGTGLKYMAEIREVTTMFMKVMSSLYIPFRVSS
jgi:class 3 adenylate cyclase